MTIEDHSSSNLRKEGMFNLADMRHVKILSLRSLEDDKELFDPTSIYRPKRIIF